MMSLSPFPAAGRLRDIFFGSYVSILYEWRIGTARSAVNKEILLLKR